MVGRPEMVRIARLAVDASYMPAQFFDMMEVTTMPFGCRGAATAVVQQDPSDGGHSYGSDHALKK
jgi:hypothetical protein